jgi:nucleoside-diphosphate-sugar epimerase
LILVTGASGFIGSALTARLASAGRAVVAGVRGKSAKIPNGIAVRNVDDLGQVADLRPILAGITCIVHAAARVHQIDDRASDPLKEFRRVNVLGTCELAKQACDAGVRRFVFLSSIKVNGEATEPGRPFKATDPPMPQDPYAISKNEAEIELRHIAAGSSMELVIVRPPLVYGPGVRANFLAMTKVLGRGIPLPLGAIHNRRSLVGIENLLDIVVRCIDSPVANGATILASDDEDLSTTMLLRRLARALGVRPKLLPIPPRLLVAGAAVFGQSARMRRLCENLQVDVTESKRILEWVPRVSVDEGLELLARHYLREKNS